MLIGTNPSVLSSVINHINPLTKVIVMRFDCIGYITHVPYAVFIKIG